MTDEMSHTTALVLQIWSLCKYVLNCQAPASDDSESTLIIEIEKNFMGVV